MNLPFGYIDRFIDVGFVSASVKPMSCRLRNPAMARLVTLASGQAFNAGAPEDGGVWPIEQELRILIRGTAPGEGLLVDSLLQAIAAKQGHEGTLRVRVPGGSKTYSATAVFDYPEIVAEGNMHDSGSINWVIVALHFQQKSAFV